MLRILALSVVILSSAAGTAYAGCEISAVNKLKIELMDGLPLHAASSSMYPAESVGATFVARSIHADGPKPTRGDIVAFCIQEDPGTIYIKRIIGLPGDRVQLIDNEVILNGTKLPRTPSGTGALEGLRDFPCFEEKLNDRSYRICQVSPSLTPLSNTREVTVPAGELFVLGDNRDNSVDSRLPSRMRSVLIENLIGIVKPNE